MGRTKAGAKPCQARLYFDDARYVLSQPMLVVEDDRKDYGEQRFRGVGQLQDIVVLIAFTLRTDVLRIISMRPANKKERIAYARALEERT
jgi:uncharacterized protein